MTSAFKTPHTTSTTEVLQSRGSEEQCTSSLPLIRDMLQAQFKWRIFIAFDVSCGLIAFSRGGCANALGQDSGGKGAEGARPNV